MSKNKLFFIVLALVIALSACTPAATPAPAAVEPAAPAEVEPAAPAEAPAEVEPAPEKVTDIGDSLVIYTAEPDVSMEILLAGFKKLYPKTEVDIIYGSAGEMTSRIIAEAAKPQADIMFSGINANDGDAYRDYFVDYMSSHDSEMIDGAHNLNGYYNYVIVSPSTFYINHTVFDPLGIEVTSYEDLLQPELKGLIVTSDPNSASAGLNNFYNILTVFGYDNDETWEYIDGLMANGLVITSSSSTVFTSVTNGEYAVGLTYEGGAANQIRDGATNCEIVFPTNGNGFIVTAGAIVKGAPHYDAAVAWIEYTTDPETQSYWANELGTTRVTNSKAKFDSPYIQDYDTITWKTRDMDYLVKNKAENLEKWNAIYNKYN